MQIVFECQLLFSYMYLIFRSSQVNTRKTSWFNELKTLLLIPENFFQKVYSEKGNKKPFFWALAAFIFFIICTILIGLVAINYMQNLAPNIESFDAFARVEEKKVEVLVYIILSVIIFVFSIILLPVTHFFATKMGGKGNFDQTVKASFYSNVSHYLLSWVPILGILGAIWGFYTFYLGFKVLHKMSLKTFIKFAIVTFVVELSIILLLLIFLAVIALLIYGALLTL